jgi:two-component system response regulator RegA
MHAINEPRRVLIVDDHEAFATGLSLSLTHAGFDVSLARDFSSALALASDLRPWLTVTEVLLGERWVFDVCDDFRQLGTHLAIATAYPSVANAVRAVREGIGVYLAKPVTAEMVFGAFDASEFDLQAPANPCWPSLNRMIWEYINQVFVDAGSMSEAARRLRLDRRSLRRMLARNPPAK